nr:helix-turn-helix domain-containing protein [Actinokineospora spheciospongiae]
MLVPNPKLVPLVLPEDERRVLEGWTRRRTTALALRARIVLACAESAESNTVVAQRLDLSRHTVGTWRASPVRVGRARSPMIRSSRSW